MQNKETGRKIATFHEDMVMMDGISDITASEQNAIRKALTNNSAVGIVAGYYDDKLTISMASTDFWNNLGYGYEDYTEYRELSLLDMVDADDLELFEPESFTDVSGSFEFRILKKGGAPEYAYAFKTESEDSAGRRQWLLSVRVDHNEIESRRALREAYAAANQANRAKTQFLTNMSHDIRTPMNAIIGMTAIAGAHIDEKEFVMDCLGKITSSSRHLLALINEILDMSRIESGKMVLTEEDFSLPELIDNMIDMVKGDIVAHQHSFETVISDVEHEAVSGDSLRIQQVFINIMGNAIKYTPNGGQIRLTISEKPTHHTGIGCYEFIIEDNGIGMSEEFQKVLFEPFVRADNQRVSEIQGTGLGMPITKNIVNMMNGDIRIDSELGKGTKVTVTIFLKLRQMSDLNTDELINLPVLVVDDDIYCCESTVNILNSIGMLGEYTESGERAVEMVAERHREDDDYFAAIIDWRMPGMDGIETTRQIRKHVGPDVPIIMLTAYDYAEIEKEARESGVDAFIAKPLFKSRLTATFKHLMQGETRKYDPGAELRSLSEHDYSGKRVLIVEDNELNCEIAVEIVGMTGASVETAVNGKEAVDMVNAAEKGYYDLVFMDIQMPIMNGYEAAAAIRNLDDQKGQLLPIIAMTANAFAEDVIMAKNAGINEHIAKPINFEKLDEIMQKWL